MALNIVGYLLCHKVFLPGQWENWQKLQYTKVHRKTEVGLIIAHQWLTVMTSTQSQNVKGVGVDAKLLC